MENQTKLSKEEWNSPNGLINWKEEFIESDFGMGLVDFMINFDMTYAYLSKCGWKEPDFPIYKSNDPGYCRSLRLLEKYYDQWEIYSQLIQWFFGQKFHIVRNSEEFGIANEELHDWLVIFVRSVPDKYETEEWRVVL